ncbi:Ca-activated chloride channel family protein [Orenia metallireducens]|jgi:Ca-activated chloride channel family protein|uniref:Ca-activated chloride channel family protein n=1 Tax=Orenia metallireducens TaxID=1413210 RepID=A0A285F3Y2_9FIRM|nr:vWA domain-containing protein [Orenia metallireducens]PRX34883.1 Ca-activated chloride channel family protein [Orenia metallireducens]SNY06029.1 Ca-activated chloride channel family protein [Orenia metallireducens]
MRAKQNLTLVALILILLSAIFGINTLNIISIPASKEGSAIGREIKVNTVQAPQNNKINIEIVWDASGSMWGKIEKVNKISQSKQIIRRVIKDIPENINLGLRVFGNKGSIDKASLLIVPLSENNKEITLKAIDQIKPSGKSPIGINLLLAGKDLISLPGEKHILLVTDGKDTGDIMPNKIVSELRKKGIKTHIIQVGEITHISQLQLQELAKLGDGKYFTYFEEEEVVPTMNLQ